MNDLSCVLSRQIELVFIERIRFRRVLSDIAVWIYQGITKMMEDYVQPILIPALLEHEGIGGLSGKMQHYLNLSSIGIYHKLSHNIFFYYVFKIISLTDFLAQSQGLSVCPLLFGSVRLSR